MAENSATFIRRVQSALLAAVVILALGFYAGRTGLQISCAVAILLGLREFSRMSFSHWRIRVLVSRLYEVIGALLFVSMFKFPHYSLLCFVAANILHMTTILWLSRETVSNENLLPAMAMGSFGLLYCVLFPFFALEILRLEAGGVWFFFLLLVVFAGDIFAYFGGRQFGRKKLMAQVSPNKTWAGAMAGLGGSCLVGLVYVAFTVPHLVWWPTLLFCLLCGFVAQSGDLLVSLVKRVAQVKDSGHIMPGHGGILDRLDGVFIACPLVYAFALYVS